MSMCYIRANNRASFGRNSEVGSKPMVTPVQYTSSSLEVRFCLLLRHIICRRFNLHCPLNPAKARGQAPAELCTSYRT